MGAAAYALAFHSSKVDCSGKPADGSVVGASMVFGSHAPVAGFLVKAGLRRLWHVPHRSALSWKGDTIVARPGACGLEPLSATTSNGPRSRSSGSTTIIALP